jgi:hypothetical protein
LGDEFLTAARWFFAADRSRTRQAVCDFLLKLPEEEFSDAMRDAKVFVIATSAALAVTSIPYGFSLENIPPGARFDRRFQVVHLSPEIETYDDSRLKAVVAEGLTQAFAVAAGLDEVTAIQLAAEARRAEARPEAWRAN